jgi:hypothetical protein
VPIIEDFDRPRASASARDIGDDPQRLGTGDGQSAIGRSHDVRLTDPIGID